MRPIFWTRVRLGVLIDPPNVSGLPKPASSMRTTSTLGASSGAFGPGIIVQSGSDWSSVRPIVPPKPRSGIGSTLRSGLNLPMASASEACSCFMPFWSDSTTDFIGEPGRARSIASRCSPGKMAMIPADPGGSASPTLSWIPLLNLWSTNLPTMAPPAAPTATEASSSGANSPTTTPTPPPQPRPLRPR